MKRYSLILKRTGIKKEDPHAGLYLPGGNVMTHRERVLRAIRFESPDKIPVIHAHLPGGLRRHREKLLDLYRKYPNDFNTVDQCPIPESQTQFYTYVPFRVILQQIRDAGYSGFAPCGNNVQSS